MACASKQRAHALRRYIERHRCRTPVELPAPIPRPPHPPTCVTRKDTAAPRPGQRWQAVKEDGEPGLLWLGLGRRMRGAYLSATVLERRSAYRRHASAQGGSPRQRCPARLLRGAARTRRARARRAANEATRMKPPESTDRRPWRAMADIAACCGMGMGDVTGWRTRPGRSAPLRFPAVRSIASWRPSREMPYSFGR